MPGLLFGSKFLAVFCLFVSCLFLNTCHEYVLSLFCVVHCRMNQVYIDDSGLTFPIHLLLKVLLLVVFPLAEH